MSLSRDEVEHIASLCRIGMTDEEVERMREELSHILEQVEVLGQVDTEGVPPTSHAVVLETVFREDMVGPCLAPEEALANAPRIQEGFFRVKAVLEE